jgi:hypothetical protein
VVQSQSAQEERSIKQQIDAFDDELKSIQSSVSVAESQPKQANINQIFDLLDPSVKTMLLKQAEKNMRPSLKVKVK